jgi:hypothetical protein
MSDDTRERRMTTPATEIQRRLSEAVIDMINEFRLQTAAGPLPDKALDHIIFRAAHSIVQVLAPYNLQERNAMWPSVIRMLLAEFIRQIGITDAMHRTKGATGKEPS